ncbi:GntR family transcriptional regulator [Alsobacter soli]|uniref:GntR family transcriptional regulator n=1 Tax=Alsobacter soli TaxID=2109933 RepID=A0A2T1HRU3_9HYPH|nr:GntR family transcriptional regulator [Alsobacter soli]PSC04352.1 GntR family transcriptional regulator [Alsobacter soli]
MDAVEVETPSAPAIGETLADAAYRLIEDAIVRLALAPGMRLTEQELAARTGLGRTPVREAVQRLVADGLLVVFPRKGMAVPAINPMDVLLALDVRAALERVAATAAARRASAAQRSELTRLADDMLAAAERGDPAGYMQADQRFDHLLGEASGNPFAARALAPLQSMARRAWYYFRREQDLASSSRLHVAVAQAIAAGDQARAGEASDALIAHVRDGLKQGLAEL